MCTVAKAAIKAHYFTASGSMSCKAIHGASPSSPPNLTAHSSQAGRQACYEVLQQVWQPCFILKIKFGIELPPNTSISQCTKCAGRQACYEALQQAWQPWAVAWKGVWWECMACPSDVDDETGFRSGAHSCTHSLMQDDFEWFMCMDTHAEERGCFACGYGG